MPFLAIGTTSVFFVAALVSLGLLAVLFLSVSIMKSLLHICAPNEVLIISGREHRTDDGGRVGFRVIHGGRAFRMPIVEKVDRMDMRLISVPMTVDGAYSEGAIPLCVQAVANVRISNDPARIGNAIERFLGHDRAEICRVVQETLEAHLRGVVATMTPEEVNEDRLKFANRLEEEAQDDLAKLGIELDHLKVQHVSDDRNYLDSIGRVRIAEIIRDAEVAESDAVRQADSEEARQRAVGNVARSQAEAKVLERRNALRRIVADLEAETHSAQEEATAAGREARAKAEQELHSVRSELERLRLAAEITLPADADRRVRELEARGESAAIEENGRAMAKALDLVVDAWRATDDSAMDMIVLQRLDALFGSVSEAARRVDVRQAALIDDGTGQAIPTYVASYPAVVAKLLEQVEATLGVDVLGALKGRPVPAEASEADSADWLEGSLPEVELDPVAA